MVQVNILVRLWLYEGLDNKVGRPYIRSVQVLDIKILVLVTVGGLWR
jgi:hypothetical protein